MADLAPGTVLADRFRVAGVLGRGGMATVYLAEPLDGGDKVALKLLHAHLVGDPAARRRLEREVEAAARLHHPAVLVARELFEADGQVGLVLPLHPGHTLVEEVAVQGPLPPEQVQRIGLRLAEALGEAHRAGVLHRDVTGRNVLLDARGAPTLTDFGLARLAEQRTGRSTALLGTTGFVAPEVLAGQRADPRSDLYGLGAVLYQAATGREPFGGGHPSAVLQAQLAGRVAPVRDRVPSFPAWLDALILSLLDPDPARRPQGALALAAALEEGRAPEPQAAAPQATGAQATGGQAAAGPPVRARLPSGEWTVVVRWPDERRGPHQARRAIQRRAQHARSGERQGDLTDLVDQVSAVIEDVAGWREGNTPEGRLAAAVAALAGLPPEALEAAPAMERPVWRLVSEVDRATAEHLADEARAQGLHARLAAEPRADGALGWLAQRWWALIPLMWTAFPGLMMVGAPEWTVFALVAATVLLSTVVGPWVSRGRLRPVDRRLPLAYRADLRAHLAAGWRERAAEAAPATDAQAAPEAAPQTQAQRLVDQARQALGALDQAVEGAEDLAAVVQGELRASSRALAAEVEEVGRDALRAEAELAAHGPGEEGAWAAERLQRVETLARAGQPVDAEEQARLQAAVQAWRDALLAEQRLESRLTADLARLLEIGATARRLRRELALSPAEARPPRAALDDLQARARAAAAARRELSRGG